MFTGIIEEKGMVKSVEKQKLGAVISIQTSKVLSDLNIGDSVAINGACQTAVKIGGDFFNVEAAYETLRLTNLSDLKTGDRVNLERAMPASGRFGGHMVSGHVDNTGTFLKKEKQGIAEIFYFNAPQDVLRYMVNKGSICINGISLTITSISTDGFSVSVIPHTIKETTLGELKAGDKVNLEADIIAKYIEKFIQRTDNTGERITEKFLQENGFYE
jgi:riboflavin synthase